MNVYLVLNDRQMSSSLTNKKVYIAVPRPRSNKNIITTKNPFLQARNYSLSLRKENFILLPLFM